MANVAPVPINMNRSVLKIGTHNYEKSVSKCRLVPTTPIASFKGIGGNTEKGAGTADWKLELDFAQDWVTANSFSQLTQSAAGTIVSVELTPSTGSVKATVNVLLVATEMGGEVDATTKASCSLEVVGQPVLTGPA